MAKRREILFNSLLRGELQIQMLSQGLSETCKLEEVQATLKEAKDIAATNKEERIAFTNRLKEKLIEPSMEFEKRNEEVIGRLVTKEFDLRKAEAEKSKAEENHRKEKERYKAHVVNENNRIGFEYRTTLRKRINFYYNQALDEKKRDKKELATLLQEVKEELAMIEVGKPVKFERSLVTVEEAKELLKEMFMYDPKDDLQAMQNEVEDVFTMYEQDIKNAAAAKEAARKRLEDEQAKAKEELDVETSTINLIASADSYAVSGAPKVKQSLAVVVENSEPWTLAVIAAFLKNFGAAKAKLQVKTWEKLSIGQMAAALGKIASESDDVTLSLPGLKLQMVEK
jgi:hypothetical protein